jgi:hypothetical protein
VNVRGVVACFAVLAGAFVPSAAHADVPPTGVAPAGKPARTQAPVAAASSPQAAATPNDAMLSGNGVFPWTLNIGFATQLDVYGFLGRGVSEYQRNDGTALSTTFEVHRIRPSFYGVFGKHFDYYTSLEFGLANSGGPNQSFAFRGGDVFAWVDWNVTDWLGVRFGQFPIPFSWENMRPLTTFDFMEPARNVSVACPIACTDTGVMLFGNPGPLAFGAGVFNGEGRNRTSVDSKGDLDARISYTLNETGYWYRGRIGASARHGIVDPRTQWGDASPSGFTTGRGYQFWSPVYLSNTFPTPTEIHIFPSGQQNAVEADLLLELGRLDFQLEGFWVDFGRREVARQTPDREETIRSGSLTGTGYYATANVWLLNPTPALRGQRFTETDLKLGSKRKRDEPLKGSLQVLTRFEQMFYDYDGGSRTTVPIDRGLIDMNTTRIRADILQVSLAFWLTTHFKVATEWAMYVFPGDSIAGDPRRVDNQALAPGAVIPGERGSRTRAEIPPDVTPFNNPSYFQPPALGARALHEISARVQLQF